MAKSLTVNITAAYVYNMTVLPNIEFIDVVDDVPVTKYRNRISIIFDVKGDNVTNPQESREYYSDPFDAMMTVTEWLAWQAGNAQNFIYAGKQDIAGYVLG